MSVVSTFPCPRRAEALRAALFEVQMDAMDLARAMKVQRVDTVRDWIRGDRHIPEKRWLWFRRHLLQDWPELERGEQLREGRYRAGMSQEDIAYLVGRGQEVVSRWERLLQPVPDEDWELLEAVLPMEEEEPEPPPPSSLELYGINLQEEREKSRQRMRDPERWARIRQARRRPLLNYGGAA
jgi:transcriptional regulator with XRE-family HTH domain